MIAHAAGLLYICIMHSAGKKETVIRQKRMTVWPCPKP